MDIKQRISRQFWEADNSEDEMDLIEHPALTHKDRIKMRARQKEKSNARAEKRANAAIELARQEAVEQCRLLIDASAVPSEMLAWKERNIDCRGGGRAQALLLIVDGQLGQVEWAKSFGHSIEMVGVWTPKAYHKDATHVIVRDAADVLKFGSRAQEFWRQMLGCKEDFEFASGRDWGKSKPCIWICDAASDPRKYDQIAKYMVAAKVVVVELKEMLCSKMREGGSAL